MASQYQGTVVNRVFETVSDRYANQGVAPWQGRQRSYSFHDYYTDGSVVRRHVHDNARSGGNQFQHVIGGWDANGNQWGRNG
ncbi:hypothetical protein [Sandarakinorhabdus oryzae]|uniref:hypothetical protein n=1 Tax=Sandarakinorhabdus oryzae TaxID=2675220 RepID=UPI0012E1DFE8|nr:hypothetical protein [Sandarakinorhabdus oryzae]